MFPTPERLAALRGWIAAATYALWHPGHPPPIVYGRHGPPPEFYGPPKPAPKPSPPPVATAAPSPNPSSPLKTGKPAKAVPAPPIEHPHRADAISALVNLGHKRLAAIGRVDRALAALIATQAPGDLALGEVIRAALK